MKYLFIEQFFIGREIMIIFLYTAIIAILSFIIVINMPEPYWKQFLNSYAVFFTVQFFLPVLGTLGILLILIFYRKKEIKELPYNTHTLPELPYHPIPISERPKYGEGCVRVHIQSTINPTLSFEAIAATDFLFLRERVKLLRLSIKSPFEESRLLSYSVLKNIEKEHTDRLSNLDFEIIITNVEKKYNTKKMALFGYWEIIYNKLVTGSRKLYYRNYAIKICDELLSEKDEGELHFTKAKLLLEINKPAEAEKCLKKALISNKPLPENIVLPLLAYSSFMQKNYKKVKKYMTEFKNLKNYIIKLPGYNLIDENLIKYWAEKKP